MWPVFKSRTGTGFLKIPKFSGLFRVPQFPLYLRNAEVLIHSNFLALKTCQKISFKTSGFQSENFLLGPTKFSGLSRNRPLDLSQVVWFNSLAALLYSQLVYLRPVGTLILFPSFVVQFHLLNFQPTMKTAGVTSNCSLKLIRHEQVFAWKVFFWSVC